MGIIAASRLRGISFNPSNLFTNGQRGAFYDPSDLSTLFQDSSGNTPVTSDGDPVGLMLDKSGNDNHAFQTDNSNRPTYQTDGNLHWIFGDGSNDFLITDEITPIVRDSTGVHFSMAAKSNIPPLRVSQYSAPTNSRNFSTVALGGDSTEIYYAGALLANSFQISKLTTLSYNEYDSHVFSFKWEGPNSFNVGQINNRTKIYSSETLASVGTFTSQPLEIFSINNGTLLTEGRIYGIFVIGDVLTETQSTSLKEYMASKRGVTL
jgi:hypothetical protein